MSLMTGEPREGVCLLSGSGSDRRLRLPLLGKEEGLAHAFTTRGADPARALAAEAGVDLPILALRQVHGTAVQAFEGDGLLEAGAPRREGDALITSRRRVALMVSVADCVPILLCDPRSGHLGAVHAGWRGTVAGALRSALRALEARGSRPSDLLVGIGPSIGPCCFEVGPEVIEALRRSDPEAEASITGPAADHVDLPGANRRQALRAGVPADRIESSGLCTVCRPDLLESYRRSAGSPGRMAGLIGWVR